MWYVALLALILVSFSGALYGLLAHGLYQQLDDSLALTAHQVISGLNIENGRLDWSSSENENSDLEAQRARGYLVQILDRTGGLRASNAASAALPSSADALNSVRSGTATWQTLTLNGESYRLYTAPIQDNEQLLGALQIAQSLVTVDTTLQALLFVLALIVPLTPGFASVGGMWFARRALAPIDQITRTAQQISANALSQRLNLSLPDDEVGRLARTFDAMLMRLDDAFRREREFTANASHELRTPLTVMRSEIDVALQRPRNPSEYQRVLSELGTDVEQLTEVAEDLLLLARADAQQLALRRESLNAAELLHAVCDQFEPLAASKHITLAVEADPALVCCGDEQKLLRVLSNLVDNALKFSSNGTRVTLSAERVDERVHLRVNDQGLGIAPDALLHIFDRFYRGSAGRTSGTGLGLAIVRALVAVQGGSITVDSVVGQGTTFTIRLPSEKF